MTHKSKAVKTIEVFETIWDSLFGSTDRFIASVSLIATLTSLVLTLYLRRLPPDEIIPEFITSRDLLAFFGLIGIVIYLLVQFVRYKITLENQTEYIDQLKQSQIDQIDQLKQSQINQMDQLQAHLSSQFKNFYFIVHEFRDQIFEYFLPDIIGDLAFEGTENDLKFFRRICDFTTNGIQKSLVQYFTTRGIDLENDISITVKLIVPSNVVIDLYANKLTKTEREEVRKKARWVITVFRDYDTHMEQRNREVGGKPFYRFYDVKNNTAFDYIASDGNSHFLNNDLQALGDSYRNENLVWKDYYNSTLVVPIRYYDNAQRQHFCLGFLAVDSLNKEKINNLYNDQECKDILSHSANLLANFF